MTYNKEFETENENEIKEKDLVETRESGVSVRLDGMERGQKGHWEWERARAKVGFQGLKEEEEPRAWRIKDSNF